MTLRAGAGRQGVYCRVVAGSEAGPPKRPRWQFGTNRQVRQPWGEGSAQERTLEVQLKGCGRTGIPRKYSLKMFEGLEQRDDLMSGGRRLFAAEPGTQIIQPVLQFASQPTHRLQRIRQAQFFGGALEGEPGQELEQPRPQPRGPDGMAGQHVSQEEGKRAPATATPAAIGAKDPLTPHRPSVHAHRIVAVELAVAV